MKSEPHEKGEGLPSHELAMALRHLIHHEGGAFPALLSAPWEGVAGSPPFPTFEVPLPMGRAPPGDWKMSGGSIPSGAPHLEPLLSGQQPPQLAFHSGSFEASRPRWRSRPLPGGSQRLQLENKLEQEVILEGKPPEPPDVRK